MSKAYKKKLERFRRVLSMENPMRQLTSNFRSLSSEEKSFCFGKIHGWEGRGKDTPAAQAWLRQREELIENERKGGRFFWLKD